MKKLLVLTLVLGVASLASATVTYTQSGDATPGGSFSIIIAGTTADMPYELGVYTSDATQGGGLMDITGGIAFNGAGQVLEGWLGTVSYFASYDGADLTVKSAGGAPAGSGNGDWIELYVDVAASAVAGNTLNFSVQDYQDGYAEVGTFSFTVVPEPATLALLGLGALVLRRRK